MEREFECYNKNIDDFDARNIFEFDELIEVNRQKYRETLNKEIENSEKSIFLNKRNKQVFSIN